MVRPPPGYSFNARVANLAPGGIVHLEIDWRQRRPSLPSPKHGSFDKCYDDPPSPGLNLTAGQPNNLRIVRASNSRTLRPATSSPLPVFIKRRRNANHDDRRYHALATNTVPNGPFPRPALPRLPCWAARPRSLYTTPKRIRRTSRGAQTGPAGCSTIATPFQRRPATLPGTAPAGRDDTCLSQSKLLTIASPPRPERFVRQTRRKPVFWVQL